MARSMLTGMVPLNQLIAANVVALRKEAKISRIDLAATTGIAERTLARRETGNSSWTTDELEVIARALSRPVADLVQAVE